jgi:hypothetical protein
VVAVSKPTPPGCEHGLVRPPPHHDRELREVAEGAIRHDVVSLCEQVQAVMGGPVLGGPGGRAGHDALLEAPLVHLRVLDDFLGTPPLGADAIGAEHFLPGRSLAPVLSRQERDEVDAVLGLGRPRRPLRTWDHAGIAMRMCEAFLGFVQHLERHPEPAVSLRAAWFAASRTMAHDFLIAGRNPKRVIILRDDDPSEEHRWTDTLAGTRDSGRG